jgi:hypothetical protein
VRKVIVGTTIAVALIAFAGRAYRGNTAHAATRAPSVTSGPTTTAPASSTTRPAVTVAKRHRAAQAKQAHSAKVLAKKVVAKKPTPEQIALLRTLALQSCLELASSNNVRVIAANRTWFVQQLALAKHEKHAAALHDALVSNETETRTLIDAQYTIDDSNCYIRYG